MLTVYFHYSPCYFLKQYLSLNLELIDWVGWSANSRKHPVSTAPALQVEAGFIMPGFFRGYSESELSSLHFHGQHLTIYYDHILYHLISPRMGVSELVPCPDLGNMAVKMSSQKC